METFGSWHGLRTPRKEIALTEWPKIPSHSQIFRYGKSLFFLPYRPNFSDIFDLCFHRMSLVRGSWGPRGLKFAKEIGRKIQEKTGNKNATSHIIQAILMTVQRGNAISIMDTLGPLRKLEDFFA